ncbi:MAG: GTPase HflX [Candidatus Heimdallarchaeota archaeon]|nr:GTPase HflX [Candidatus Heimdallarchaeota archaeon]MCG3252405.1 GTPase HflX [Candidatus Heimdallarchaeota archaeon]MCK4289543.1 GTPase HflX [Candidatus Heimdallarchaeota archaeon]
MLSKIQKRRAILTEVIVDRKSGDHLAELSELAYVAGYNVIDRVTQKTDRLHPEYLFGKGKAKQIKGRIKELQADIVIIENKLDAIQLDNLRKMWRVEIIDRFEIILEIFIKKAGTQEALTQIRLAALKKVVGSRFESHRSVTSRNVLIKKLEKKLELIKKSKDLRRKRRLKTGFDLVAIAGYTNSGKSTLMNALTEAEVEISGRMFTTLDTTTRSFDADGRKILITDTVGFISRLPHVLMAAFYATLKEITEADLVLLLIDCNDSVENIKMKVLASMNTLGAIEADVIPLIPVLNKMDIAQNRDEKLEIVKAALKRQPIMISAKDETNMDTLRAEILNILETYYFHLKIPNSNEGMSLVSRIHDKTRITEEIFHETFIEMRFETNERLGRLLYNTIKKSNLEVEIINEEILLKQLKKKETEPKEDGYTIIKTESGEEFVIFDLIEEKTDNENQELLDKSEKLGKITSLEEQKKGT